MLSFDSALSNALKLGNTTAFWVLKLYYNAEGSGDFIGVSDTHRVDGSDIYYGLVSSWGNYSQSLDFFNFTTSVGNMSVRLINTDQSIKGGRFSDLFSTNNFANRKWELFLNTNQAGTYDTAARMIGTGIISGDIGYDYESVKLTLLDNSSKYHKRLPTNVVTSATYTNAPEKNIEKPIPIAYGDFHDNDDAGTIPTDTFDRHYNYNPFPAIITDKWNQSGEYVFALGDNSVLHTLDAENIYMFRNGAYLNCDSGNTNITSNPTIKFRGSEWYYYTLLSPQSGAENGSDGDFDTEFSFTVGGDPWTITKHYGIPKIPKLGIVKQVRVLIYWEFTGTNPVASSGANFYGYLEPEGGSAYVFQTGWNPVGDTNFNVSKYTIPLTGSGNSYTATQADECDLEGDIYFVIVDTSGRNESATLAIQEIGIEVKFAPEQIFSQKINELYHVSSQEARTMVSPYNLNQDLTSDHFIKSRTITVNTPAEIDYIYFSGLGRKYTAFIDADSRNNGYNKDALIENPIYIIEDILRSELGTLSSGSATSTTSNKLVDSSASFTSSVVGQIVYNTTDGTNATVTAKDSGTQLSIDADIMASGENYSISGLTSSEIDYATFDISGNTTDGYLGDIFNDAVGDVQFAFSQHKFINSKDLINKICDQTLSWVFIGGDGKFKIKTLRRTGDYSSADKTIDYNDITLKNITRTSLNSVRNDITINYNHDYGQDQNLSQVNTTDSTSQGTTVNGNNQALKLVIDADGILDSTTATKLADAYKTIFKDRKIILNFDCVRPLYNDLEIGDIITFDNWDTNLKLYGTAFSSDYFIVQDIAKRPEGCSIKSIKVDA